MSRKVFIDFETFSPVNLKDEGAYKYLNHPEAEVVTAAYAIDDGEVVDGIPDLLPTDLIIAHNATFEYMVLVLILNRDIKANQMYDTMAMGGQVGFASGLNQLAEALGLGKKDPVGKSLINRKDLSEEERAALKSYCRQDVSLMRECFDILASFKLYTKREHKVFTSTLEMNMRGIPVHRELIDLCDSKQEYAIKIIEKDFKKITSEMISKGYATLDTTKWKTQKTIDKKLAEFAEGFDHKKGARIREVLGVDTLDKRQWDRLEKEITAQGDELKSQLWGLYKKISYSSIAKIKTAKNFICDDDRIRGVLVYHGAHSGRYTSKGYQIQNMPRKVNGYSDDEIRESISKLASSNDAYEIYDLLSGMIRHFIYTPKGLCIFDYKSIELYVARSIVGDPLKPGEDGYQTFAAEMFNKDYKDVTKQERNEAKVPVLGFQYQAGASAIQTQAEQVGIHFSDARSDELHSLYQEVNYKICEMWDELNLSCILALNQHNENKYFDFTDDRILKFKLPSGRKIGFLHPSKGSREITYYSNRGRDKLYGGKLFNYMCQGTGRDLLVHSMLNFSDCVFMSVHDEVVAEGTDNYDRIREAMEQPKWYLQDCLLIAEGTKGVEHYGKY